MLLLLLLCAARRDVAGVRACERARAGGRPHRPPPARPPSRPPTLQADTYWQSDGPLPHTVTIQFFRRQSIAELALFLSFGDDDSYTPEKFTVRSSTGLRDDLADLRHIELPEGVRVSGWVRVPLHAAGKRGAQRYLRSSFLQLSVTYMYSNGRDLRIRAARVLVPDEAPPSAGPAPERFAMPAWETPQMYLSADVR